MAELEAKANTLQSSQTATNAAATMAGQNAMTAKAKAMQEIKEDAYKPVFKAIRDSLGVSISTGVMLVTLSISTIFEISHLLLILFRAQQRQRRDALRHSIIGLDARYMEQTGKAFDGSDFAEFAQGGIPRPEQRQDYKQPKPGFGFVPQRAQYGEAGVVSGQTGYADTTSAQALFKWQESPQEAKKPGFGFIPSGNTYRQELRSGSKVFSDQPLDSPVQSSHAPHARVGDESGQQPEADIPHAPHARVGGVEPGTDEAYQAADAAKVGSRVGCPQCGTEFVKRNQQHRFCCKEHRFAWHNERDPKKQQFLKDRNMKG